MQTANRPYLVWDAERGVFIVPFHAPPRDAPPPQTLAWQPRRLAPVDRAALVGAGMGAAAALIVGLFVLAWVFA